MKLQFVVKKLEYDETHDQITITFQYRGHFSTFSITLHRTLAQEFHIGAIVDAEFRVQC